MNLVWKFTLLCTLIGCAICQEATGDGNKPSQPSINISDIKNAWKLDLTGLSLNPNNWSDDIKHRLTIVGAGTAYAASLSLPAIQLGLFAIYLYGLVRLDWILMGLGCMSLYGYKRNNKIFLCVGLLSSYCVAFGYSVMGA